MLREVRGFDPEAATPLWMQVRLARSGMRSVSLAVDVTNYLMLELGQPLHAFDRSKLHGPVVVRRARPGETLTTLDHVTRTLDAADILITDDSGPISLAGTMGGLATEIDDDSTDIVIEGAHFSDTGTAKMARRHRLHSEASYRFERGTDRELPPRATARAAALLASLGGATVVPGATHAQVPVTPVTIQLAADYPDRVAGVVYGMDTVVARLQEVGCEVRSTPSAPGCRRSRPGARASAPAAPASHGHEHEHGKHDRQHMVLLVTPPSWRPDLTDAADLAEEVIRLEGYGNVPVRQPRAPAGQGLTERQRSLRAIARTLGAAGFVEVHSDPFAPATEADSLMLAPEDPRRPAVKVANPLSEDQPQLRTTLLPGLFRTLVRNIGRGFPDTALFETGQVFLPRPGSPGVAPILATDRGPTEAELATLAAALPDQPPRVAGVLAGHRELPGWWGPGRAETWSDAIEAARSVGAVCHLTFDVRAAAEAPWHPGRCAALYVRGAGGRRPGTGVAGRARGRAAPAGDRRVRPAAADERVRARLRGPRGRRRGGRAGARPGAVRLPARDAGRGARRGRGGARRRGGGRAHRGGGGAARGRAALRRLHRRPARRGPQVPRVHAAAARPRPDPDRRGGDGRPRRRGGRGRPRARARSCASRTGASERVPVKPVRPPPLLGAGGA